MLEIDILFLISFLCIFACIFFTMGRFIEKPSVPDASKADAKELYGESLVKSNSIDTNADVVDAEYEEIYPEGVINFQEFKKNKQKEKNDEVDSVIGYEWMYSKRDETYVKVPRDIADFIKYLKKNMNNNRYSR